MPSGTQAKLLRVLEDSRVRRLGGKGEISVDVRVIAATNRNVDDALKKGDLREDLYYRLNVFQISLPPLRQRLSDLPVLCETLIVRVAVDVLPAWLVSVSLMVYVPGVSYT